MQQCLKASLVVFSGIKIDKMDDLEAMINRGAIRMVISAGSLAMALLKAFWSEDHVHHEGQWWSYDLPTTATRTRTPPPLYFGGTSEPAREAAAQYADVYLMWIETVASTASLVADLSERAARHGRTLRFGLRTHVIVRDTEDAARSAAAELVSELDPAIGRGEVWEHLGDHQAKAFQEVVRVARAAILSFPLLWDCPKDSHNYPDHHMITDERIAEWTIGLKPNSIEKVPRFDLTTGRENGYRAIYFWTFN